MSEQMGFDIGGAGVGESVALESEAEAALFAAGRVAQFKIDCEVFCAFCAAWAAPGERPAHGPAVLADPGDPAAGYEHRTAKGPAVWCDATALRLYWDETHGGQGAEGATDAGNIGADSDGLEPGPDSEL